MKQKKFFNLCTSCKSNKLVLHMFTVAENFYATLSISEQIPPKNVLLLHVSSFALGSLRITIQKRTDV